jgi:NAD(P)-dependent dehydrogenase (short-subunit alcohol dehydrogenase family)
MLEGKSAVVTGGGRGVGRAVALALGGLGASVVVNDIGGAIDGSGQDRGVADEVVRLLQAGGGAAVANYASVASMDGAQSLIDAALSEYGRLDILVNCAGNSIQALPWEMTEEAWDSVTTTHLKGHFACMRAASVPMIAQGSGSMVAVSSSASLLGVADAPAYCAAKAGILGLMRSFALALEPHGVTVNAIVPSTTTRMSPAPSLDRLRQRAAAAGIGTADALGEEELRHKLLHPDTIANFVAFLASPAASGITGSAFAVTGGHVGLYGAPEEVAVLDRPGGAWSVEDLADAVPGSGLTRRTIR